MTGSTYILVERDQWKARAEQAEADKAQLLATVAEVNAVLGVNAKLQAELEQANRSWGNTVGTPQAEVMKLQARVEELEAAYIRNEEVQQRKAREVIERIRAEDKQRIATLEEQLQASERDYLATVQTRDHLRQKYLDLEAALKQAGEVKNAANVFLERLEVIHADERYKSVWTLYMLHGGNYTGPQYDKEMNALRAAIESVNKEGE